MGSNCTKGSSALGQNGQHVVRPWPNQQSWESQPLWRDVDVDAIADARVVVLANKVVQRISHQSLAVRFADAGLVTIVELIIDQGNIAWQWECLEIARFDAPNGRKDVMYLNEFDIGPVRTSISGLWQCCNSVGCLGRPYTAAQCNCQSFVREIVLKYSLGAHIGRLPSTTGDLLGSFGTAGMAIATFFGAPIYYALPIAMGTAFGTGRAINNIHSTGRTSHVASTQ